MQTFSVTPRWDNRCGLWSQVKTPTVGVESTSAVTFLTLRGSALTRITMARSVHTSFKNILKDLSCTNRESLTSVASWWPRLSIITFRPTGTLTAISAPPAKNTARRTLQTSLSTSPTTLFKNDVTTTESLNLAISFHIPNGKNIWTPKASSVTSPRSASLRWKRWPQTPSKQYLANSTPTESRALSRSSGTTLWLMTRSNHG